MRSRGATVARCTGRPAPIPRYVAISFERGWKRALAQEHRFCELVLEVPDKELIAVGVIGAKQECGEAKASSRKTCLSIQ